MPRAVLFLLYCLGSFGPAAAGQEPLAWKFAEGDVFYVRRVYLQKQIVEVKDKTFRQNNRNLWLDRFRVEKKEGEVWRLRWTLEDVRFRAEGPIGRGNLDKDLAERMQGAEFEVLVTPAGKIARLEGYGAFLKKVVGDRAELEKVLRVVLSEDGLRAGLEEIFTCLPEAAPRKDLRWQREVEEPLPPFGSLRNRLEFAYEGAQEEVHAIACTIRTEYRLPARPLELLKVMKGEVAGEKAQARYRFDARKGRLVDAERVMNLRGTLTVEIGDVRSDLRFTGENRLDIRLFEERPEIREEKD